MERADPHLRRSLEKGYGGNLRSFQHDERGVCYTFSAYPLSNGFIWTRRQAVAKRRSCHCMLLLVAGATSWTTNTKIKTRPPGGTSKATLVAYHNAPHAAQRDDVLSLGCSTTTAKVLTINHGDEVQAAADEISSREPELYHFCITIRNLQDNIGVQEIRGCGGRRQQSKRSFAVLDDPGQNRRQAVLVSFSNDERP